MLPAQHGGNVDLCIFLTDTPVCCQPVGSSSCCVGSSMLWHSCTARPLYCIPVLHSQSTPSTAGVVHALPHAIQRMLCIRIFCTHQHGALLQQQCPMPSETGTKLTPKPPSRNPRWAYMPASHRQPKQPRDRRGIWSLIPLVRQDHATQMQKTHMRVL